MEAIHAIRWKHLLSTSIVTCSFLVDLLANFYFKRPPVALLLLSSLLESESLKWPLQANFAAHTHTLDATFGQHRKDEQHDQLWKKRTHSDRRRKSEGQQRQKFVRRWWITDSWFLKRRISFGNGFLSFYHTMTRRCVSAYPRTTQHTRRTQHETRDVFDEFCFCQKFCLQVVHFFCFQLNSIEFSTWIHTRHDWASFRARQQQSHPQQRQPVFIVDSNDESENKLSEFCRLVGRSVVFLALLPAISGFFAFHKSCWLVLRSDRNTRPLSRVAKYSDNRLSFFFIDQFSQAALCRTRMDAQSWLEQVQMIIIAVSIVFHTHTHTHFQEVKKWVSLLPIESWLEQKLFSISENQFYQSFFSFARSGNYVTRMCASTPFETSFSLSCCLSSISDSQPLLWVKQSNHVRSKCGGDTINLITFFMCRREIGPIKKMIVVE